MATIVNNPSPATHEVREVRDDRGAGSGFIVGLILIILLAILFFAYGVPALRGSHSGTLNVNVNRTSSPSPSPAAPSNGAYPAQ